MEGHVISIGDVYALMRETRDDVISMKESLRLVLTKSEAHEERIKHLETSLTEKSLAVKELDRVAKENEELSTSIDQLSRKVYTMSGGAAVVATVAGAFINKMIGA